jgi:DNA-binding CsgD family transcriptional regulator
VWGKKNVPASSSKVEPGTDRSLVFVVECAAGSLVGALMCALLEKYFEGCDCQIRPLPGRGTSDVKVVNQSNGATLWVIPSPPRGSDVDRLSVGGGTSIIHIGASREELEAAFSALQSGEDMVAGNGGTSGVTNTDLTPREREVARLVAQGLSNPEVAAVLGVSPHTIRTHVASACSRLGVNSRARLAAKVRDLQL